MGADKAIHIQTEQRTDQEVLPLAVAKILKSIAEREDAKLVLVGKQSIDGDNAQTGPMLSALLNWPLATFAAKLSLAGQVTKKTQMIPFCSRQKQKQKSNGSESSLINHPSHRS